MVSWEALDALSRQLELCNIGTETSLAVVIDPAIDSDQIELLRAVVERSGASAVEIHIAPRHANDNPVLAAAVAACDLVITTGAHHRDLAPDSSQLLYLHPLAPHSFAPHRSLRRRVDRLVQSIDGAATMRLSDANGSLLSISLGGCVTDFDHGFVDAEHRCASFPAGWVAMTPAAGSVSGQLVLMPGDANLGVPRLITSPVVLQLTNDHVSAIQGDNPDADIVRALLEHPGQPAAYGFAGLSIGLNPGSAASGPFDERLLDAAVSRLLAGVVRISLGNNLVADRPCAQTVTLALRNRSVHIDELAVLIDGQLEGDLAPDVYEL